MIYRTKLAKQKPCLLSRYPATWPGNHSHLAEFGYGKYTSSSLFEENYNARVHSRCTRCRTYSRMKGKKMNSQTSTKQTKAQPNKKTAGSAENICAMKHLLNISRPTSFQVPYLISAASGTKKLISAALE